MCKFKYILALFPLRNGLSTQVLAGLGNVCTSSERSSWILQNVSNTKCVAIEAPLVALLLTEGAQWFVIHRGVVNVFAFVHFTVEQPPAHGWLKGRGKKSR